MKRIRLTIKINFLINILREYGFLEMLKELVNSCLGCNLIMVTNSISEVNELNFNYVLK